MRVYKRCSELTLDQFVGGGGSLVCLDGLLGLQNDLLVRDSLDELDRHIQSLDFRVDSLDFRVDTGDYFINLATVLDLMRQVIDGKSKQNYSKTRQIKQLKKLRDDLLYLQRNYEIVKK